MIEVYYTSEKDTFDLNQKVLRKGKEAVSKERKRQRNLCFGTNSRKTGLYI